MPLFRTVLCLVAVTCTWIVDTVGLELPEAWLAYDIEVTLDPESRRLEGRETIRWVNQSRTTVVDRVPMHLYLNGFSHEDTTWMRSGQGRAMRPEELVRLFGDPWGWSDPRSIRQGGVDLSWAPIAPDDGNPFDRSLIEVTLAEPVGPGETLVLVVEFEARLPIPFARTGGYRDFFLVAQWFPKIAVFETAGVRGAVEDRWNAHQFHGPTEFYADYADFDVRIGVPQGWTVVATGDGGPEPSSESRVWYRFRQRAVHDFAFAAGSAMAEVVRNHDPEGPGAPVEVHYCVPMGTEHQVPRWRRAVEAALDILGSRVGPYPYRTLTVVFPPFHSIDTFGMEYPTFITGAMGDPFWDSGPVGESRLPEVLVTHEFVHQYFYGMVGSNEFEEAFLDEGFTEYWGHQVIIDTYGDEAGMGRVFGRPVGLTAFLRVSQPERRLEFPPIRSRPAYLTPAFSKTTQFYMRPAATLSTAAALYGQDTVDRVFAAYFKRWAFRHPGIEDFLDVARQVGGDSLADFFIEAYSRTRSPDFQVVELSGERWHPPDGRLVTENRVLEPGDMRRDETALAGLDPAALEADGMLTVEIRDPGFGEHHEGGLERRSVAYEQGEADEGWEPDEDVFYLSTVRIEGPAWENLPVEVVFRFLDGAVFRETWDGRALSRGYRFLRPAPLSEVRIDPEGKIVLDPDPANNGRLRTADKSITREFSMWVGALFQLLAEGISQWL
jgi:hypothetical protein